MDGISFMWPDAVVNSGRGGGGMGVVTLELMLPCEGCCELRKRGLARSALRPCSASRLRVTALFGAGALCGPTRAWSR